MTKCVLQHIVLFLMIFSQKHSVGSTDNGHFFPKIERGEYSQWTFFPKNRAWGVLTMDIFFQKHSVGSTHNGHLFRKT